MPKPTLEELISKSVQNVSEDRQVASQLLEHLRDLIANQPNTGSPELHAMIGNIAAKYMESVQRGNEQLIKIAGLMTKKGGTDDPQLTPDDIYNMLEEGEEIVKETQKTLAYVDAGENDDPE